MTDLIRRQFDFLSILTALVVLSYVGASAYALFTNQTSFADFSGAVGPVAGLLLGYWVRGTQPSTG